MMQQDQMELAAENLNLAFFLANRYGNGRHYPDRDDDGVAMEALCQAAIRYKPSDVPFSAYAAMCITHKLAQVENGANRAKRQPEKRKASLDKIILCDGDRPLTLGDIVPSRECVETIAQEHALFDELRGLLRERDYALAVALSEGQKKSDIARAWGVSPSVVHKRVKAIKKTMERNDLV